jgi:periplasmic protein TonB
MIGLKECSICFVLAVGVHLAGFFLWKYQLNTVASAATIGLSDSDLQVSIGLSSTFMDSPQAEATLEDANPEEHAVIQEPVKKVDLQPKEPEVEVFEKITNDVVGIEAIEPPEIEKNEHIIIEQTLAKNAQVKTNQNTSLGMLKDQASITTTPTLGVTDVPKSIKFNQIRKASNALNHAKGQEKRDDQTSYEQVISSLIAKEKKYPRSARKRGVSGMVTVKFTVLKTGKIVDSEVVVSAKSPRLDNEALAMLERVSPLPAIPIEFELEEMTFVLPIEFSLR